MKTFGWILLLSSATLAACGGPSSNGDASDAATANDATSDEAATVDRTPPVDVADASDIGPDARDVANDSSDDVRDADAMAPTDADAFTDVRDAPATDTGSDTGTDATDGADVIDSDAPNEAGLCGGCVPGEVCCVAQCVNLQTDALHCGACDVTCATPPNATATCTAAVCGFACTSGYADCDGDPSNGCEVQLATDPTHCGSCGMACPAVPNGTSACAGGACTVGSCSTGFADCDLNVANGCETVTASDIGNCGACGNVCVATANATPACVMGVCGPSCMPGFGNCDGVAANGCETNLQTDVMNCSACGSACMSEPNSTETCVAGACSMACNMGFADCNQTPTDGCEVNLENDVNNCGACFSRCNLANANATCSNGACAIAVCTPGFDSCDGTALNGCETNTFNDPNNCGTCGHVCNLPNASSSCTAGTCTISSCNNGFQDCDFNPSDGCEVSTTNDPNNCGGCGHVCFVPNGSASCSNSNCAIAQCNTGFANCNFSSTDGCETNVTSDPNNCGGCGVICPSGSSCLSAIAASFAAQPTGWNFSGSASYDASAMTGRLTVPGVNGQAGTIIYQRPIVASTFTVTFDVRIDSSSGRADGLVFMMETNGATSVGNSGAGLGATGLSGYAAELDIYNNSVCYDANGNHAGIDSLTVCDAASGAPTAEATSADLYATVGDIADFQWRTVRVSVASGAMTMAIGAPGGSPSAISGLSGIALPAYNAGAAYYLGFAGGTGGLAAGIEIRNVTITFPTGTCI